MLDPLLFALSAALAQVATNLDNLAVLLVLLLTVGAGRAVSGFVLSQALMLAAALALAVGTDRAVPQWAGLLGLVPLTLGLRGLWTQHRSESQSALPSLSRHSGLMGCTFLFLGLSFDSFLVMMPLLADSAPLFRIWALSGAALAVAGMALMAMVASRASAQSPHWVRRLERLGPVVMVLVGLYVLLNTGTDQI